MGTPVEVLVLGPLQVRYPGKVVAAGGRNQRIVLALLALSAGRAVAVDTIAEALWGDDALNRSRSTLQVYVSNLRRLLDASHQSIENQPPGYMLAVGAVSIDASRFEEAVRLAAADRDRHDVPTAADRLSEALSWWSGPCLADLDDVDALAPQRRYLNELRMRAYEERIDADLALGRHAHLIPELEASVIEHPVREQLWGQLMVALYRSGRQSDALRAFQAARARLVDDVGVDPGPTLQRLERSILGHSHTVQAPSDAPSLLWLDSTGRQRRLDLSPAASPILVGRLNECHISLPWDARASRRHAAIHHSSAEGWRVEDGGSANGTFVNGERVNGHSGLADGDLVRFGDTVVIVRTGSHVMRRGPITGETLTTRPRSDPPSEEPT